MFFLCRYSHCLRLIEYDRETTHELHSRKLRVETRIGSAATEEIRIVFPVLESAERAEVMDHLLKHGTSTTAGW